MRVNSCYGINDLAMKYLEENDFVSVPTDKEIIIENLKTYVFEPIEKFFYDSEPEYFMYYVNDQKKVVREYSQILFHSSGACEFLALEQFNYETEFWDIVESSLWKESEVPVGYYSPSLNHKTGIFCRQ